MISLYFGLPGCGKSTLCVAFEKKFTSKKGKKKYRYVYSNSGSRVEGVVPFNPLELGYYEFADSLILIDEAQLFFDTRDYKNFGKALTTFFFKHRHSNVDIFLFAQRWDGLDLNIRMITDHVFYVWKPLIFKGVTKYVRVPYGVVFPSSDSDKAGEIVMGYHEPSRLQKLLAPRIRRKKFYSLFDSWEHERLKWLPAERYLNAKVAPPAPYVQQVDGSYAYVEQENLSAL